MRGHGARLEGLRCSHLDLESEGGRSQSRELLDELCKVASLLVF
jgi:hypothetical protein